jgi:hypothetical protein
LKDLTDELGMFRYWAGAFIVFFNEPRMVLDSGALRVSVEWLPDLEKKRVGFEKKISNVLIEQIQRLEADVSRNRVARVSVAPVKASEALDGGQKGEGSKMKLRLADINEYRPNMFCTPTMICAISDISPDDAGVLLQKAAKEFDVDISAELRRDYDINHWLRAVKLLGGAWQERDNFEDWPFDDRPDIDEWMRTSAGDRLELVYCDDNGDIGHTFATFGGDVVDTYTDGKRVKFNNVPARYRILRVKRSFVVNNSAPS